VFDLHSCRGCLQSRRNSIRSQNTAVMCVIYPQICSVCAAKCPIFMQCPRHLEHNFLVLPMATRQGFCSQHKRERPSARQASSTTVTCGAIVKKKRRVTRRPGNYWELNGVRYEVCLEYALRCGRHATDSVCRIASMHRMTTCSTDMVLSHITLERQSPKPAYSSLS